MITRLAIFVWTVDDIIGGIIWVSLIFIFGGAYVVDKIQKWRSKK